jgi:hypothetical protein
MIGNERLGYLDLVELLAGCLSMIDSVHPKDVGHDDDHPIATEKVEEFDRTRRALPSL